MATVYDLTILLDPNVPDDRHREILASVQASIEGKGTLVGHHDWGLRRMAFEIDDRPDAAYHLFQLEGPVDLLDQLRNTLKITDGVLRHRIIKVKPGTPPPPTPRAEAPRPAREPEPAGAVAARAAADAPAPTPADAAVTAPAEAPPAAAEAPPALAEEPPSTAAQAPSAPAEAPSPAAAAAAAEPDEA